MDFLNRVFRGDKVVWVVFMLLLLISVVEVFSAASMLTYKSGGNYWWPIRQHSTYLFLGFVVVYIAHLIPYRFYKTLPLVLVPASICMLIWVLVKGVDVNDAARWMKVAGFTIQPSEFAKVGVVMGTAVILSRMQTEDGATPQAMKWILWMTVIVCGLIAPENLSTAVLLFGVVFLMMYVGRIPMRQLGKLVLVLGAAVALFLSVLLFVPSKTLGNIPGLNRLTTWQARIQRFGDSEAVPAAQFRITDENFQETHATMAIASSNIIGRGPGNSVERDYLPQAYSDFIFAIIIEELGLLGGAFVVLLYIILLIRAAKIAQKSRGYFPAFLVMGCALMLVAQAMLNMMVAVGLFPVTGQPLPLISRGGTSTLINCCYIGMILSVSYHTEKMTRDAQAAAAEQTEEDIPEILRDSTIVNASKR
ncbi:MAG: FtsW/RodA/SpoVE family cell cycle protein [Bacteroidaceae bacterium]|nr:FtsW/RodA/SpoVE family cell cycle protein [Bacteroidaceae bacterium]MBR3983581.1 FtsW/RodA/SpoVE family cell cycle protein [Bacteroidaceae bacterium]